MLTKGMATQRSKGQTKLIVVKLVEVILCFGFLLTDLLEVTSYLLTSYLLTSYLLTFHLFPLIPL